MTIPQVPVDKEPSKYYQPVNDKLEVEPDEHGILHVCSSCGRYLKKVPGKSVGGLPYQEIGPRISGHHFRPNTSHGYCYNCYMDMLADLDTLGKVEWTKFGDWLKHRETLTH